MIWWLKDPARARAERQALAELAEAVPWLGSVRWQVGGGGVLTVNFDIEHDGTTFPLAMAYSAFHPDAPPTVTPRDGSRLSGHQYGAGGSLCLEYRADNWETGVTGAMMVESAHRLIAGERDPGEGEVPSAHRVSAGQRVRGHKLRFLLTEAADVRFRALAVGAPVELGIAERWHCGILIATVTEIEGVGGFGAWPIGLPGTARKGFAVRIPAGSPVPSATLGALLAMLDALGLNDLRERVMAPDEVDLVVLHEGEAVYFSAYNGKDGPFFFPCSTVVAQDAGARLPAEYAGLAGARVGIVGCGSLGSKVAAMLVRAGLRRLALVDDDLMFEGNLARHELGGTAVGVHKVVALKDRLVEIAGELDVVTRAVALGGQESAVSTESVMASLAECDVIIDASADPHCFNFCAAAARAGRRPMAWAEVFAGGVGGLVARVRPDREPDPQAARNRIDAWCRGHGVPAPRPEPTPYAASDREGAPLVADDADVSVVAAHLARLVIDLLVRPGRSAFPSPAYVIGLKQEWIFSAPFDTWPVDFDATPWEMPKDEASAEQALELLRELMPAIVDDNDQPAA